jgi:hypothetical protein
MGGEQNLHNAFQVAIVDREKHVLAKPASEKG